MPLTLSQLAPFISQPVAPRYHGGLNKVDDIMAIRAAAQRDRGMDIQEAGQAADIAAQAQSNARGMEALAIQRAQLQQSGAAHAAMRAEDERNQRLAAMAQFVDVLDSPLASDMDRALAIQKLQEFGMTAEQMPPAGGGPAIAEVPSPGGILPAAPTLPPADWSAGLPLGLAQEENAFNWTAPVRPSPARMDVTAPEVPREPLSLSTGPLQALAPSGPSARGIPDPKTAALAGGAAGLAARPMTTGALDATRLLPTLGAGIPEAAPGLPKQALAGQPQPPQRGPGGAVPAPVGGIPAPGTPVAPATPPTPPTPEVARWRLRRGDDVLMELDPAQGTKLRQDVVVEAFAPLVASARTPDERRAASLGMQTAKEVMAAGEPTKVAIEKGREAYQFEIGESNAMKRAGIAAGSRVAAAAREVGGTGMNKDDYGFRNDLIKEHVDKVVNQVSTQRKFAKVNEAEQEFGKLLALGNEKTGFADSNAVVAFITALQTRATDADYRNALDSGGIIGKIDNFVGRFDPSRQGTMGEDYMRQVKGAAEAIQQAIVQEKVKIADQAEGMIRQRAKILHLGPEDTEMLVDAAREPFQPPGYTRPSRREEKRAPIPAQHGGGARAQPSPSTTTAPPRAGGRTGETKLERARRLGAY